MLAPSWSRVPRLDDAAARSLPAKSTNVNVAEVTWNRLASVVSSGVPVVTVSWSTACDRDDTALASVAARDRFWLPMAMSCITSSTFPGGDAEPVRCSARGAAW